MKGRISVVNYEALVTLSSKQRRPMLTHTGKEPHKYPLSDTLFSRKDSLRTHRQIKSRLSVKVVT